MSGIVYLQSARKYLRAGIGASGRNKSSGRCSNWMAAIIWSRKRKTISWILVLGALSLGHICVAMLTLFSKLGMSTYVAKKGSQTNAKLWSFIVICFKTSTSEHKAVDGLCNSIHCLAFCSQFEMSSSKVGLSQSYVSNLSSSSKIDMTARGCQQAELKFVLLPLFSKVVAQLRHCGQS